MVFIGHELLDIGCGAVEAIGEMWLVTKPVFGEECGAILVDLVRVGGGGAVGAFQSFQGVGCRVCACDHFDDAAPSALNSEQFGTADAVLSA